MTKKPGSEVPSALAVIEEATQLLRQTPATVWSMYAIGTLPFGLALLYFLLDMTQSAAAVNHLLGFSLLTGVLYVWMSCWQAAFSQSLAAACAGQPAPVWTRERIWQLILAQGIWQPTGLIVLPVAAFVALPFGWAYAWYQNLAALDGSPGAVARSARRQALLWPGQNHVLLSIVSLFALFVFIDLLAFVILLPILFRMLTGVETLTTSAVGARLNSTTIYSVLLLHYLCLDPLMKACYVLRCFYGDSLRTGEDLRAGLRRLARVAVLAVAMVSVWPASAQTPPAAVNAQDLDRSLDRVIHRPEFAWRIPRAPNALSKDDPNASFLVRAGGAVVRGWRTVWHTVERWVEQLYRALTGDSEGSVAQGKAPAKRLQYLLYALSTLLAIMLIMVWWRINQQRRPRFAAATAVAAPPIDLSSENVTADQLPEDGWTRLAQEWMGKNDPRMALRALYLATLANLAQREVVALHPAKTNAQYAAEVQRRTRSAPVVSDTFRQNLSTFERIWYGEHEVTPDIYEGFHANYERLRQQDARS